MRRRNFERNERSMSSIINRKINIFDIIVFFSIGTLSYDRKIQVILRLILRSSHMLLHQEYHLFSISFCQIHWSEVIYCRCNKTWFRSGNMKSHAMECRIFIIDTFLNHCKNVYRCNLKIIDKIWSRKRNTYCHHRVIRSKHHRSQHYSTFCIRFFNWKLI